MKVIDGGVTAPKGFLAASTAAGIKYKDRSDMAMIYSTVPCKAAGTFTTNVVKAAPVLYDKKIVTESKSVQAVVVNAGIANACTGAEGFGYCEDTAKKTAAELNLAEDARKEGATAICHGATGKGNDQIRFELGIKALAPDLKIIAAWRDDKWNMDSREAEIEYCKAHGIDLPFSADSSYSRDRNLWHISHEGLELEDPANEPNYDHLLVLGVSPEKAPDEGEYVTMTFEGGVPKSVNGKEMKVSDIIRELNRLGGKHGIGIVDIVENRVVGMKSRGVYETPGGTILMEAHQQLEELILDRDTMTVKKDMGNKFAQIVYEGKWFTPLREAVQAFVESTQKYVTGEVKFKLYKGNIIKAGTTSPYSLYSESLASFTTGDLYDHHDAEGFITLFGLPLKVRAMKMAEIEKNK